MGNFQELNYIILRLRMNLYVMTQTCEKFAFLGGNTGWPIEIETIFRIYFSLITDRIV